MHTTVKVRLVCKDEDSADNALRSLSGSLPFDLFGDLNENNVIMEVKTWNDDDGIDRARLLVKVCGEICEQEQCAARLEILLG